MKSVGDENKKHFNIKEAEEFSEKAFVRKRLFETSDMNFNIYCIRPGQQNPMHKHPNSDEILYFVEGIGECIVGDDTFQVKPGDVVLVPKNASHAILNMHESQNMVCVLAQSPLPCEHVSACCR